MTEAPSDQELVELLNRQNGIGEVIRLSRRAYRYATSAPLEELHVETGGGTELDLIFKDLSRDRLIGDAAATKPEFLHLPEREIETYQHILASEGIGPGFFGAVAEPDAGRYWLLIEKVPGVELWQVGELSVWEDVAHWLGRFHSGFAARLDEMRAANPHLLDLSVDWFRSWHRRAVDRLTDSADGRAVTLRSALGGYDEVADSLAALPRTFVHGELYPSNVLVVRETPLRISPVDWEMAAIGPGLVDLAALVGGWGEAERGRLTAAYVSGRDGGSAQAGDAAALDADLARCRLHLALQWLGWSAGWRPPPEHDHDWLGEALELAEALQLDRGKQS
jgi:Ser/Thr protein kinase RdoA (MazF antagonist)